MKNNFKNISIFHNLSGLFSFLLSAILAAPVYTGTLAAMPPSVTWLAVNQDGMGVNGLVNAIVMNGDENVYIAGGFLGGLNRIAKWNGREWSPLGNGLPSEVLALALDSIGNLYASIYYSGGAIDQYVAKWDGNKWSVLGSFTWEKAFALVADGKGNLYAGGIFSRISGVPANNIAKWNGSNWSALGSGTNGPVLSLAFDHKGNLYAGGSFTIAGGDSAISIAKWDGNAWSPSCPGMRSYVRALVVDDADTIYAGGSFTKLGEDSTNYIAKWDGNKWKGMGRLPTYGNDRYNEIYDYGFYTLVRDRSGNIYAGGNFFFQTTVTTHNVGKWDGSKWCELSTGMTGTAVGVSIKTLAISKTGVLYAGGSFEHAGDTPVFCLAAWSGSWTSVGGRNIGSVYTMVKGKNGEIYVGGNFGRLCGLNASGIVRWDGTGWDNMSGGMSGFTPGVIAMAADQLGNLYAGGWFLKAGSVSAEYIAKWNGSAWSKVGVDSNDLNSTVRALAADKNGNLYVGGDFTIANGDSVNHIAQWDGVKWNSLGSGFNGTVAALAIDRNGNIIAGGNFTKTGTDSIKRVAKWDGQKWNALGSGVDAGDVYAVAADSVGNVYIGGSITKVGGVSTRYIARWDGIKWTPIDTGIYRYINAFTFDGLGNLYACSPFSVYRWDGSKWPVVGDADKNVNALAVADSTLFVGGDFSSINNVYSPYLAKGILHDIGTQADHRPFNIVTLNTIHFRLSNSILNIAGIDIHDYISIYSLSGRIVKNAIGTTQINLRGVGSQLLLISVKRNKTTISTGIVMLQ
jgi:trimeric autotransporter adhesin